ncbi:hypothetical protein HZS_699 [Henneguya salminicola]|nr:hypothetical protein HZS_699 [Henneguya salminicola]
MRMSQVEVKILKEGYYIRDASDSFYFADCSCTLIITQKEKIIVDPGGVYSLSQLQQALEKCGLDFASITIVICTHGHSDHIGNISAFPHAKHIVSFDINIDEKYFDNLLRQGIPYVIEEGSIEVWPTPGHTSEDISVVVYNGILNNNNFNTIVVAGDLFENECDEEIWRLNSTSFETQFKNRERILEIANVIVPGHGKWFLNTRKSF